MDIKEIEALWDEFRDTFVWNHKRLMSGSCQTHGIALWFEFLEWAGYDVKITKRRKR